MTDELMHPPVVPTNVASIFPVPDLPGLPGTGQVIGGVIDAAGSAGGVIEGAKNTILGGWQDAVLEIVLTGVLTAGGVALLVWAVTTAAQKSGAVDTVTKVAGVAAKAA
jgi:hypothetical protein